MLTLISDYELLVQNCVLTCAELYPNAATAGTILCHITTFVY